MSLLPRLASLAILHRQAARQRLAAALSEREAALDHLRRVGALIAETGPAEGSASAAGLGAAASLRGLLQGAGDSARARVGRASDAVEKARAALASAEARHSRLAEMQAEAARRADALRERRAADDRPHRRKLP